MKTYFTFENLYRAYLDCRKQKTRTLNHLVFAENLEENLFALEKELQERTYRPGRSIAFVVQRPKIREIFAADFRDRVVHHLLFNYLLPIFEKIFIYDSWACRKGKGTHRAMKRLQYFTNQIERERKGRRRIYFLQADIKSFFTSIDQKILFKLVKKRIRNPEILWLSKIIIFHDCVHDIAPKIQSQPSLFERLPAGKSLFKVPRGKGLPIGNLTSQFFANVYLNELDQFVKHVLKVKFYVRYVDDFVILGRNIGELKYLRDQISSFLKERLQLCLHPIKQKILSLINGIDFVGYIVRPEYVLVRRRVVGQFRRRLEELQNSFQNKACIKACNASYFAHIKFANGYWLKKKFEDLISAFA